MQIYIMDGDYEVMKKLDQIINGYSNCTAKCFTNAQKLVDAVRKEPPDAVLLDLDTPESVAAVRIISSQNRTVKLMSMSERRENAVRAFELGMVGFILKPVTEDNIKEQLFHIRHPLLAKLKRSQGRTAVL